MGNKEAKSGECAVLDGERALDRQYITEGRLDELWERKRRLAFHYARVFYLFYLRPGRWAGWAAENILPAISHEGFLRAIRGWDESRGGFNLMLKMAVREEARRQLCLDRRDIRNILLGHENNGAKAVEDEIQAPPSAEKLSSDFMDEVMAMPEDMRRIVLHCIDNAHRYPHARLSGSAKMGLKRGESNGLLLDACGGSICEARKAMVIIKAWLRGKRGGELIRVSREYSLGLARNKTKNRRKYARLRAEKGGLAE